MIRCPHCKSYAVEFTGQVLTTYPEQYVYKCSDCNKQFNKMSRTEPINQINVTKEKIGMFLTCIVNTGEIPNDIEYNGQSYYFSKCNSDKYYYVHGDNVIYLYVEKELIFKADSLYEQIQDLCWSRYE